MLKEDLTLCLFRPLRTGTNAQPPQELIAIQTAPGAQKTHQASSAKHVMRQFHLIYETNMKNAQIRQPSRPAALKTGGKIKMSSVFDSAAPAPPAETAARSTSARQALTLAMAFSYRATPQKNPPTMPRHAAFQGRLTPGRHCPRTREKRGSRGAAEDADKSHRTK